MNNQWTNFIPPLPPHPPTPTKNIRCRYYVKNMYLIYVFVNVLFHVAFHLGSKWLLKWSQVLLQGGSDMADNLSPQCHNVRVVEGEGTSDWGLHWCGLRNQTTTYTYEHRDRTVITIPRPLGSSLQFVNKVSYRILSWGGHGDSRMIVACVKCVCLLGGSGGMLPQENLEFRPSQIASDAICDKTLITVLNFMISGVGNSTHSPPHSVWNPEKVYRIASYFFKHSSFCGLVLQHEN